MQTNRYLPLSVIAVAIISGCATLPNPSLTEAHNNYNNARTNPDVTNLAAVELKDASDTLNKADYALNEDDNDEVVNHLAYIANQQVGIAQETAKRKTAELAVNNAGAKRDQVRLEARTAEADASKQQVAILQENAEWQNAELAAANANTERDQELIAQQEMQLKELNAKKTERGLVITLGDVLFRTNKAQLESGGIRNVEKLGNFLTQYPQYKVLVEGYTDSRGSNDLNQELSDRRAYSVRTALMEMQISNDRVSTRGYGEEFPVASNDNAASRQLNRRVEIVLSDSNGTIVQR
ncbi:MAG: OmpA family protein [Methylococcaceae bacterium]|nr:OmpA family protein [Methylococcaceae bacterium]